MDGAPPQQQTPVTFAPQGKAIDADTTKWLLKYDEQLDIFYHELKGEMLCISDDGEEWKPKGQMLLNDKGIVFILSSLRDTTNKYAMMANIEKEERMRIAKLTCRSIAINLALEQREYEMDTPDFFVIMSKIENIIDLALSRPVEGKEREIVHRNEQVIRQYYGEEQTTRKEGGHSWLPSFFKR